MTATIIAIAQRKGGAGKTTLAAHLAVTWAIGGRSVTLIDVDPQASLAQWHQRRESQLGRGSTGLEFAAVGGWRAAGEISRRARAADIVLVDSPASADHDTQSAIGAADLVLVPVQPSPMDVWACRFTLEIAQRERVPVLLVLNRVPARACLTAAMREWLVGYEVGLSSIVIGNRVGLAAALADGWGIAETARGSLAAQEIAALAAEISELMPAAA
ncbi:MAG: ParA family partition ATPase [Stellaceae bacterium]